MCIYIFGTNDKKGQEAEKKKNKEGKIESRLNCLQDKTYIKKYYKTVDDHCKKIEFEIKPARWNHQHCTKQTHFAIISVSY